MILIYRTNDRADEALRIAPVGSRFANPKYFEQSGVEWAHSTAPGIPNQPYDRVLVLDGSPFQEEIVAAYGAREVAVEVVSEGDEVDSPPAELPPWEKGIPPEIYLKRWPNGPEAELAHLHVARGQAG